MAVRTSAAQALDASIDSMLSDLDTYLALAGQAGESNKNAAATHFMGTLVSKLMSRQRMKPLIIAEPGRMRAFTVAERPTNTVEARDPLA